MNVNNVEITKSVIHGLLNGGVSITEFAAGLNNAFVHGEIFNQNNQPIETEHLVELYDGIDRFTEAAKKIKAT